MKTKIQLLQAHLNRYGSITKAQAARKLNIYGLAEQVRRLRGPNMRIDSVLTPNGKNSPYATYTVIK